MCHRFCKHTHSQTHRQICVHVYRLFNTFTNLVMQTQSLSILLYVFGFTLGELPCRPSLNTPSVALCPQPEHICVCPPLQSMLFIPFCELLHDNWRFGLCSSTKNVHYVFSSQSRNPLLCRPSGCSPRSKRSLLCQQNLLPPCQATASIRAQRACQAFHPIVSHILMKPRVSAAY